MSAELSWQGILVRVAAISSLLASLFSITFSLYYGGTKKLDLPSILANFKLGGDANTCRGDHSSICLGIPIAGVPEAYKILQLLFIDIAD